MASTAHDQQLTAEEFVKLEIAERAELVDGVIVEDEDGGVTSGIHGIISGELYTALRAWAGEQGTAFVNTSFALARAPDRVRRPDVAFVFAGRLTGVDIRANPLDLVPDVAAEVLSPSETLQRIAEKLDDYRQAGIRLVWQIDPLLRYIVAHPHDQPPHLYPTGSVLDGGDVLPGFALPVSDLLG